MLGTVINSYPPPGGVCDALTYGKGYLFSRNSSTGSITVFDPITLHVVGVIRTPETNGVEGLAFRESTNELFIANQNDSMIYVGVVRIYYCFSKSLTLNILKQFVAIASYNGLADMIK